MSRYVLCYFLFILNLFFFSSSTLSMDVDESDSADDIILQDLYSFLDYLKLDPEKYGKAFIEAELNYSILEKFDDVLYRDNGIDILKSNKEYLLFLEGFGTNFPDQFIEIFRDHLLEIALYLWLAEKYLNFNSDIILPLLDYLSENNLLEEQIEDLELFDITMLNNNCPEFLDLINQRI